MRRLFMTKGSLLFLVPALVLALFTSGVQASIYYTYTDATHDVKATIDETTTTLTVKLENLELDAENNIGNALSGFYVQYTGPALNWSSSSSGPVYNLVDPDGAGLAVAGYVGSDLAPGWAFEQIGSGTLEGYLGLSSIGGTSPYQVNGNVPQSGNGILDGADYEIVQSDSLTTPLVDGLSSWQQQPFVVGEATFVFEKSGTGTFGNAIFTFGTGPDFVTPLPGAALLAMFGVGALGMRLRKFV